jgi:hypothetical protein
MCYCASEMTTTHRVLKSIGMVVGYTLIATVLLFPVAPVVFIWAIFHAWEEYWKKYSPEQIARIQEIEANRPKYHLVPYAVEWGSAVYRRCYCDGSVCGAKPRGSTEEFVPDVQSESQIRMPQAGEFTPQNVLEALADKVEEGHLWLPKKPQTR